MRTCRIVFIEPPVSLDEIYGGLAKVGAVSPPLNLLLLAAIVREHGHIPSIIDCPAQGLCHWDVIARLSKIRPEFVGITAMTPHIMQAGKLATLIKKELPGTVVLLGGAHISAVPEATMSRFPSIDVGFLGGGRRIIKKLIEQLQDGVPAHSVQGTISRLNGKLINTGQREERIDLDALPLYAWDLLEGFPHAYKTPLFAAHRTPATPIITSRGCPGKCIFCYSGGHKTLSTYSAGYILSMLKHLKHRYGIREFMIYDDNFVMFKTIFHTLLSSLIEEKINLSWSCNARVDMVDEDLLHLMARAGCWQISYGIETGNQSIMDRLEKKITREKVRETLAMTRRAGIRTVGYFMIGHFGETLSTIQETINFSKEIALDDFRMSFFTPLPGTKAAQIAGEYGDFENNWGKMNLFSPVFVPTGMTKDELIKLQKHAIRKFFFRPRTIWSYLKMVKNPATAVKGAYLFANYVMRHG